ncbi:hypothetical protein ABZ707_09470 [Streptomyces sp. NPDC006923]|uniref:hypothetical protein n=1 Tax=Streptomyces sp. NPDC006923 TaxID=3155355 RepID=UPI0033E6FC5A
MICRINLHIVFTWQQTTGARATATTHEVAPIAGPVARPPDTVDLPPPNDPEIRTTT